MSLNLRDRQKEEKALEDLFFHSSGSIAKSFPNIPSNFANKSSEKCISRWENVFVGKNVGCSSSKTSNTLEKVRDKLELKPVDLRKKPQSKHSNYNETFSHYENIEEYARQYRECVKQKCFVAQSEKELCIKSFSCCGVVKCLQRLKSESIVHKSSFLSSSYKIPKKVGCADKKLEYKLAKVGNSNHKVADKNQKDKIHKRKTTINTFSGGFNSNSFNQDQLIMVGNFRY